jgi:hypothetical protein
VGHGAYYQNLEVEDRAGPHRVIYLVGQLSSLTVFHQLHRESVSHACLGARSWGVALHRVQLLWPPLPCPSSSKVLIVPLLTVQLCLSQSFLMSRTGSFLRVSLGAYCAAPPELRCLWMPLRITLSLACWLSSWAHEDQGNLGNVGITCTWSTAWTLAAVLAADSTGSGSGHHEPATPIGCQAVPSLCCAMCPPCSCSRSQPVGTFRCL